MSEQLVFGYVTHVTDTHIHAIKDDGSREPFKIGRSQHVENVGRMSPWEAGNTICVRKVGPGWELHGKTNGIVGQGKRRFKQIFGDDYYDV